MAGRLKALVNCRCPRCHEGKMFKSALYHPTKFYKMEPNCEVCGVSFRREPGFYFGAMYVSYAIITGLFLVEWFLFYFLGYVRTTFFLFFMPLSAFVLLPIVFRYSRALYLYGFSGIKFDESFTNK